MLSYSKHEFVELAMADMPLCVARSLYWAMEDGRRLYHTPGHVLSIFRCNRITCVEERRAIWFHDAIYVPRSKQNEERSARFYHALMGHDETVMGMIRTTACHLDDGVPDYCKRVMDYDLTTLRWDWPAFKRANDLIMRECNGNVGELQAWLLRMLNKKQIYYTMPQFEGVARANLGRLLKHVL